MVPSSSLGGATKFTLLNQDIKPLDRVAFLFVGFKVAKNGGGIFCLIYKATHDGE